MADAGQYKKVKAIVEADPARRVIVVSAAGKRYKDDHKLTDLLYLCHAHKKYGVSCDPVFEMIAGRYRDICAELGLGVDIESELSALRAGIEDGMSKDRLVSRGEYFSARLMADYLGYDFLDAELWLKFSFDGSIDKEQSYENLRQLAGNRRVVIPGFYGAMPDGSIKVLTRGGSDVTGALAAAALDADVYENWTDVSGILMADPKIVKDPKPIPAITYGELREMAFMGASVLHEESILPVREKGIPLNIRNTNCPDNPGTMIVDKVPKSEDTDERFITGIAGRRNFSILTVRKRNITTTETLRRALEVFDRYKVAVEHITLGLDSFALVASTTAMGDAVYDIISDIQKTCRPDDVRVQDDIALIAAVGRKMSFRPGVSGRLFKALGEKGISVRTIAQGADELSIIVGVENDKFETAIQVLYDGFAG